MKRILLICTLLFAGLAFSAPAFACEEEAKAAAAPADISVDDLAAMINKKAAVTVVDANSDTTREKFGVIPGAVLLTAKKDLSALPNNKAENLVFYCSSERCASAPKAAQAAMDNGYTSVSVLRAGIKGWKAKGLETKAVKKSKKS